jgi:RNA-directed DNA polymerase
MAVAQTGAASHDLVEGWHDIDWKAVDHNVRRLQARIVKATQAGKWGKVKALQHLLTHSFSGKALAVRRVTENQGKQTPGVDKITWNTPHKKINAVYSLRQRGYHPQPLRRISIPKKNGKKRPLGIPMLGSYCPPYRVLSGFRCRCESAELTHAVSTIPYFPRVDEGLVVSNGAESACAALR